MAGRKRKPYQTTWRETIPGLAHDVDGRWRIVTGPHAGKKWHQSDERRAVEKAKVLLGLDRAALTAVSALAGTVFEDLPQSLDDIPYNSPLANRMIDLLSTGNRMNEIFRDDATEPSLPARRIKLDVPDAVLYPWLREQITDNAVDFFNRVGLPEWASRAMFAPTPQKAITIQRIIDNYQEKSRTDSYRKNRVKNVLKFLMKTTGAKLLSELNDKTLLKFKEKVEKSKTLKTGDSRTALYGTIKAAIAFGMKCGLDKVQLRATLDACNVLWTTLKPSQVQPKPISRADYHTLLAAAEGTQWLPWVVLSLNLCMSMNEVCGLKWDSFDFDGQTFCEIRGKNQDKRIPRAATLWPQAVKVLEDVKRKMKAENRKSPYVFISKYGNRYNRNTRINDFRDFATDAKLAHITFSMIRDGAYTAAERDKDGKTVARVLAGHRAEGYKDNYVLRDPECVRPACDAVYRAYIAPISK
jgi:integrase